MKVRIVSVVALLLLAGCTGPGRRSPAPAPTGSSASLPVGKSRHTLTVDGQERTYQMYRPAALPENGPAPLVVVLHGAVGSGNQAETTYGWDAQADTGRFLVAYPDGLRRAWNVDKDCCGVPARDDIDDVGFIERLVQAVPGVDADRVYATGISNGAMLSYRLACDTDIFAAIAPVSGTMINNCPDPDPVSLIHIHGTEDRTIPYAGGPGKRDNQGAGSRLPVKIDGPPVPDLVATWRATDKCAAPTTTVDGPVTISAATCPDGRAVELITVAGAGHQWPGAAPKPGAERLLKLDPPTQAVKATPTIWEFFAAHPRKRANG
jgi:polyhydroxybutyrate depolymerase